MVSCTYMSADFTSSMGMTPFFSPSMGSAKRLKASLISPSSCGETLCSLASLDWRALGAAAAAAAPPDLRFGGCEQTCQWNSMRVSCILSGTYHRTLEEGDSPWALW